MLYLYKISSMNHRYYFTILFIGILFGVLGYHFIFSNKIEHVQTVDSTIVLEKIEAVSKMVTAEGTYSNIYHIEDHYWMNVYPFKKQATIKVSIKALVGVDLSKMVINVDEVKKIIYLENIPDVEPIALDTRVDYFDMSEGMFNQFNKEDINYVNDMVRTLSQDAIEISKEDTITNSYRFILENYSDEMNGFFKPLVNTAREQGYKQIMLIEFIANITGWQVIYDRSNKIIEKFKD
jgi:hypothetical protein